MSPLLRQITRFALVATLAACAVDDPAFTPIIDAPVDDGPTIDSDLTDAPPGTATLTVTRDGTAAGTITSNPGGISCGTTCSASFALDTMVTLIATPDAGAQFAGWAAGPRPRARSRSARRPRSPRPSTSPSTR